MTPSAKLGPLLRIVLALSWTAAPPGLRAGDTLDLSGPWRLRLDPEGAGTGSRWYATTLDGAVTLPGSLPAQGIGDPVTVETRWTGGIVDRSYFTAPAYAPFRKPGNIKVPFWLQPEVTYVGPAWYQRDVVIPDSWSGHRIVLFLERPHWKTTAWIDGRPCGTEDSLSVAHVHDLGASVAPGHHVLTLRVDNSLSPDIGENSHSVSDHTQGNWNGIVGRVELMRTELVWIDDLQVFPRSGDGTAVVRGRVSAAAGRPMPAAVTVAVGPLDGGVLASEAAAVGPDGRFAADCALGPGVRLWDEFSQPRYRATASLDNGERRDAVFGFREVSADGHNLMINGRKLFLRGTLDCAAYPLTGHPPVDLAAWLGVMGVIKAHGLNHVRFHSWCPPEAAFEAADTLGVYLQVEMASWPNQSTTLGDGKPVDAWIDAETDRILHAYGNHPSLALVSACNEPGGDNAGRWLSGWITRHKAWDTRHLYTSGSGWPELPENDYNVRPQPRIQHWGEGLGSRINRLPPETRTDYADIIGSFRAPVVSHEIGQWCAYPDFREIPAYTGYLKARNFEIFRSSLAEHRMLAQAHDFLLASGRLQALCYKEDIESALRTRGMGGFQLLGLSDFPGQGTALVGVLNALWGEKGYITPQAFRRFCNATVPLARMDRRVFTTDERLVADVEVAHFGPAALAAASATWRLLGDDGQAWASGRFGPADIPVGAGNALGRIDLSLRSAPAPAHAKLVVAIEGTDFENDWDLWVYPPPRSVQVEAPAGVFTASDLDGASLARLDAGGRVVLLVPPERVRPDPSLGKVEIGFSSIFWNTAWTQRQAPHTLGILCDPRQPALAGFPTEGHSDWQWWYPVAHSGAMILDALPADIHPIVQVVDDWATNRKLALVFEARVGSGRLLVTSIDFRAAQLDPVRRQLLSSLLRYAAGPSFNPSVALSPDQVRGLIARGSPTSP